MKDVPLYEYHCSSCGRRFSLLVPASKRDEARCPDCGQEAKRLLSGFGIAKGGTLTTGSSCGSGAFT